MLTNEFCGSRKIAPKENCPSPKSNPNLNPNPKPNCGCNFPRDFEFRTLK